MVSLIEKRSDTSETHLDESILDIARFSNIFGVFGYPGIRGVIDHGEFEFEVHFASGLIGWAGTNDSILFVGSDFSEVIGGMRQIQSEHVSQWLFGGRHMGLLSAWGRGAGLGRRLSHTPNDFGKATSQKSILSLVPAQLMGPEAKWLSNSDSPWLITPRIRRTPSAQLEKVARFCASLLTQRHHYVAFMKEYFI